MRHQPTNPKDCPVVSDVDVNLDGSERTALYLVLF